MNKEQIQQEARNKYKSIDQSQLGHTLMHAQRSAFEQGAEWMEEQLEPIITEYGMNQLKLRSMLEELLGYLEDEVLSSSITDTLKRAHDLLDKY